MILFYSAYLLQNLILITAPGKRNKNIGTFLFLVNILIRAIRFGYEFP